MTTCIHWDRQDIENLRNSFLQGVSIKLMARSLKRTPGVVNKALTRFDIRTPRSFKKKVERAALPKRRYTIDRGRKINDGWVPFKTILAWLDEHNCPYTIDNDGHFKIAERLYTRSQILVYVNKRRLERGEKIFLVDGITW